MSVVPVTPQTPVTEYPTLPVDAGSLVIDFTTGSTDGVTVALTQHHLVLVRNDHATDPKSLTVVSVPDSIGRSGDIAAYDIDAGDTIAIRFRATAGWKDSGSGLLTMTPESADLKFAVLIV